MSWGQPSALAEFPPNSPFLGIPVPKDVRISQQVLAEPTPDLAEKTWARLADGTPLVTAEKYTDAPDPEIGTDTTKPA